MRILNISFHLVNKSDLESYIRQHRIYRKVFCQIAEKHKLTHLHLVESPEDQPSPEPGETFVRGKRHFPFRMFRVARKLDPDVVFLHSINFPLRVFVLKAFLPKNTRYIVVNHAEMPSRNILKRILQRVAYSGSENFLFCSKDLAEPFIDAGIIRNPGTVQEVMEVSTVMTPVNRREARIRLGLDERIVLAWVGRLNRNKDPFTPLTALAGLRKRNWVLFMFYTENTLEREVKEFIYSHGLGENVILKGTIPNAGLSSWYSAADFFISASHYEGSGVALCEAMACNCVPIVSNIPSFRFMTKNGVCAHLYPPGDVRALSGILENAMDGKLAALTVSPRAIFDERLSYDAVSKQLLKIAESTTTAAQA